MTPRNGRDGDWTPQDWRSHRALQQPAWLDANVATQVVKQLSQLPALVFAGETRALTSALAEAGSGRAFVLQAGDCAEDFSRCHGPAIHDLLRVILQMAIVLTFAGEKKVVKIGRVAGQYAKPRSSDRERVGGTELPSYRGDMVNAPGFTEDERRHDPRRMLEGYFRSTATLNLIRAFTSGGYASLDLVHAWSEASWHRDAPDPKYGHLVDGIRKAMAFMSSIGIDKTTPQFKQTSFYTSHEALLLEYEEALTRIDTTTGRWYDTSAHMLWIGERTRQVDGAHVEFLRGVNNPIGVKIGPDHSIDDIKRVIERLNAKNEPGRLALITRFGASRAAQLLPSLLSAVQREGFNVVWLCDPMHGNTRQTAEGRKLRRYEDILHELQQFWLAHAAEGTIPGGVHLELTGESVTECTGGRRGPLEHELNLNYRTSCDPRLNSEQAVELAFEIAHMINPRFNP